MEESIRRNPRVRRLASSDLAVAARLPQLERLRMWGTRRISWPWRTVQLRFIPAFEALLGIVVILVIGAGLPGQTWGLVDVQPHPLWIVVLAIAVRYGALSGYLAGGLSALTYGLLLWTRPEARFQLIAPHELFQSFLMFVVGAGLGELVDARERRVADLETRRREVEVALESLWQRHRTLEEVTVELEKQIAFQSSSIVTLSTLGKKLQSLQVPELHRAIVDLVSTILEVDACSVYLFHEGQLLMEVGRPENWHARPQVVSTQSPLISWAIRERRVITIRDRLPQEGSQSTGNETILMVGPLTLSGGQIYGVVIIESMPFIKFTPSTVDRFDMILGWASKALENALLCEQALLKAEVNEKMTIGQVNGNLKAAKGDGRVPRESIHSSSNNRDLNLTPQVGSARQLVWALLKKEELPSSPTEKQDDLELDEDFPFSTA